MEISIIFLYLTAVIFFRVLIYSQLNLSGKFSVVIVFTLLVLPLLLIYYAFHDASTIPSDVYFLASGFSILLFIVKKRIGKLNCEDFRFEENWKKFYEIKEWMTEEKKYLAGSLKLSDVAKALHFTEKEVSNSVNECAGENFNTFVNRLRIEEAKKLLADQNFDHWTIDAIGESVGFSNKVSFYSAFRRIENCSPSEFKKRLKTV